MKSKKIPKAALFFGFLGMLLFNGSAAWAGHIPYQTLREIVQQVDVPYCLYSNRVDGTDYDCYEPDVAYIDCFVGFLHDELATAQQALELLGQLKLSNAHYDYYDLPVHNEYLSFEDQISLSAIEETCDFMSSL